MAKLADLILIPRDSQVTQAIILEFKSILSDPSQKAHPKDRHRLSKAGCLAVISALKQIHERGYDLILNHYPSIQSVLKVGIAFAYLGKKRLRFIANRELHTIPIEQITHLINTCGQHYQTLRSIYETALL